MQDVRDSMAVATVDEDGAGKVVLHLQTTCRPRELCQQCLAKSSLMGAALPRWLYNNRLATLPFPRCTNGTIIGM
jgi:hypothetical protein